MNGKRGQVNNDFSYDPNRNLRTQVKNQSGTAIVSQYDYQYDPMGRRTNMTTSGTAPWGTVNREPGTLTYATNNLNQYTQITQSPEPATQNLMHDEDGNLISIAEASGVTRYVFNVENQLIGVSPQSPVAGSKKVEFAYDYMGRRVEKKVFGFVAGNWQLMTDSLFLYDGWNLISESTTITGQGGSPAVKSYVWGQDLSQTLQGAGGIGGLIATVDNGETYHYFYDGNGNVAQLVKASDGSIAAHYEYDPYGNITVESGSLAKENPIRFSTKYFDDETGIGYWGFRFYSPTLGRWINRDPFGEEGGFNLYAFALNNPICKIDLLGLSSKSDIANGRLQYSCNCGWIDWGHALPSGPKGLWQNILAQNGEISKTGTGYKVIYEQRMGGFGVSLGYTRQYFVKFGLSQSEQESVALAIFKEVSEGFEGLQSWTTLSSGFSEEDLISNLIGFYRALKGFSRAQIEEWCHGLSIKESEKVWDAIGGLKKNKGWKPVSHNDKTSCCDGGMKWPAQLDSIKSAPKGTLWRNWYEKDMKLF